VLEFRAANQFNIKVGAEDPAFWDKAVATVRSHRPAWLQEARPARVMPDKGLMTCKAT
jgi:hypothetical protein